MNRLQIGLLVCLVEIFVSAQLSVVNSTSFDCNKAKIRAEMIICSDQTLSRLDDRLAALYRSARQSFGNDSTLIDAQRDWLSARNQCVDILCLTASYNSRISQLQDHQAPTTSRSEIPLQSRGGVHRLQANINGRISLEFLLDSGASDVSLPADVVLTLMRTGTIADSDFIGTRNYRLADGRVVPSLTFRIRSLRVGTFVLTDVVGSLSDTAATPLLGQSFLSRFRSWSIDNQRQVLILSR
jgi:uncharacterized protein